MTPRLHLVIASTRPNRIGPVIAQWFYDVAKTSDDFDVHLVDLLDFELPVYDEPLHPRLQKYEHEHTRRWSESVAAADAFVFVAPEYNYGPTPALLNALNYVYLEWNYKPCAFVSYGGISGGLRGVQVTKQIVTTLKMMPIFEAVVAPMVGQHIKDGKFVPNDLQKQSAEELLKELKRWAVALAPMRAPNKA